MRLADPVAAFNEAKAKEDVLVVISRGLVYLGLFFLPLLKFKITHGLNVSDGIFALSAILLFVSRRPPPRAPRTPAWYVGAFIFLLAGVVASTQAESVGASLLVVGNAVYLFFVLQYLLRQQLGTPDRMRRAMSAFVFGTGLSAFVAILQVGFHLFLSTAQAGSIGGNSRAIGLSTQPNLAGVSFALGITFGVGILLEYGLRKRWYIGAAVLVLAAALLLSASVSGMGSTLVGLLVLFIARGTPLKTVLTIVLALGAVYMLVFGVIDRGSKLDPITRIEKTTNANGGTNGGTLQLRIDTIEAAWGHIEQKPITGNGLDQATLAVYFDQTLYVYYPPHNLIALYWYGGGIFMLVALFIMVGSAFSRLLSGRLRGRRHDPARDILLAACVLDLFFAMQSPELVDRWFWLPFLLAMCVRDQPPESTPSVAIPPIALPLDAPGPVAVTVGNGAPRRVQGTVGRHVKRESNGVDATGPFANRTAPRPESPGTPGGS